MNTQTTRNWDLTKLMFFLSKKIRFLQIVRSNENMY